MIYLLIDWMTASVCLIVGCLVDQFNWWISWTIVRVSYYLLYVIDFIIAIYGFIDWFIDGLVNLLIDWWIDQLVIRFAMIIWVIDGVIHWLIVIAWFWLMDQSMDWLSDLHRLLTWLTGWLISDGSRGPPRPWPPPHRPWEFFFSGERNNFIWLCFIC